MTKSLYIAILGGLLFFSTNCLAQSQIDSLSKYMQIAKGDEKVELLNLLATEYLKVNPFKSIEYTIQAIQLLKSTKNQSLLAETYNIQGRAYFFAKDYKKSAKSYEEELEIIKKMNNPDRLMRSLFNVATLWMKDGKSRRAIDLYTECLTLAKRLSDTMVIIKSYEALAKASEEAGNYKQAYTYYSEYNMMRDKLMNIATQQQINVLQSRLELEQGAKLLKEKELKKKINALNQAKKTEEKLISETKEKEQAIGELHETMLKKDTAILKKDEMIQVKDEVIQEKETTITQKEEKIKEKNLLINIFVAFGMVILIFTLILLQLNRKIKHAYRKLAIQNTEIMQQRDEIAAHAVQLKQANYEIMQQNEEITVQKEVLTKNRDEIARQNENIMDSIQYALRIQTAILPPDEVISSLLSEYFILWQPRDIVSGDFYWINQIGDTTIIVAADCTGHGVPGAFMSMLGVTLLNEVVNNGNFNQNADQTSESLKANEILNELRLKIKNSLRQTGRDTEAKDGMDISLCLIDFKRNKLQFSGAYNSLYLIRRVNDETKLIELKADRMPIGIYLKDDSFTNHDIDLQAGDTIYISSDGYPDQFGGDSGEKYKIKRFKKLLCDLNGVPLTQQKAVFEQEYKDWTSFIDETGKPFEQVDDILIFGFKV